jgi:hypothetical protein
MFWLIPLNVTCISSIKPYGFYGIKNRWPNAVILVVNICVYSDALNRTECSKNAETGSVILFALANRVPHLRRSFIAPKVGEAPQNSLKTICHCF